MSSPLRKSSFGGGEVAPSLHARVDLPAYASWLKKCLNFVVVPQGGVRNRPGTQIVAEVKDTQRVSLLPFRYNSDESYILEFGEEYIRFVREGAQLQVTDLFPSVASHEAVSTGYEALKDTNPTDSLQRSQRFVSVLPATFSIQQIQIQMAQVWFFGYAGEVSVAIYSDAAGLPDAPVAGLDFADFTTLPNGSQFYGAPGWETFSLVDPLAPPVVFGIGETLHVVVKSDATAPAAVPAFNLVRTTDGDAYAAGALYSYYSGVWNAVTGKDMLFRILSEVDPGPLEVATTYLAAEHTEIKGRTAQSADVLFIPSRSHKPAELQRQGETQWAIRDLVTTTDIDAPGAIAVAGDIVGSTANPVKDWWYVLAAINAVTGNESYGSIPHVETLNISPSEPARITLAGPVNGASGYNVYRGRNYGTYGYIGTMVGEEFDDDGQQPDYTTTPIADPDLPVGSPPATASPTILSIADNGLQKFQGTWYIAVSAVISDESYPSTVETVFNRKFPWTVGVSTVAGATEYRLYRGRTPKSLGYVASSATVSIDDPGQPPNYGQQPVAELLYQSPGAPPITFSDPGDYPSVACFMDQRLMLAGTNNDPDTLFGSRIGSYRNFSASSPAGASDAFKHTLAALTVDRILGLVPSRVLLTFTEGSEYVVQGQKDLGIGPATIDAKAHAFFGSGSVAPLPAGGRVLFSQREGPAVREFRYDFQMDGYTAEDDRSVLAHHLLESHSIVDWAFQQSPQPVVWIVREDGVMLGITYLPAHDVIAWHQHETDGLIESVATIPEGNETAVYLVVKRQVEGQDKRFIERLASREIADLRRAVFLDCSLTYDGSDRSAYPLTFGLTGTSLGTASYDVDGHAIATIDPAAMPYFLPSHVGSQIVLISAAGSVYRATIVASATDGMSAEVKFERDWPTELQGVQLTTWQHAVNRFLFPHLGVGAIVSALVDGSTVHDLVVDSTGLVEVPAPGVIVTVGLPYTSEFETLDINVDQRSLQTVTKVVGKVWLDFVASKGLFVGENRNRMHEWKQRRVADGAVDLGAPTPMFNGRDSVVISGGWGNNGNIIVQQRDPLPVEITSITPEVTFGG